MNPFIKGKRINLTGLIEDDLPYLKDYANNEIITYYMMMGAFPNGGCLYCSRKNVFEEFTKLIKSDDIIFCIRKGKKIIGIIGLYEFNQIARNAELRVVIGEEDYLNKGYGMESVELILKYGFDKLNLHKIRLGCNSNDERANKCYKKCGFILEGIIRDYHFRNGVYYNANMYSILENEWRSDINDKK